MKISNLW